MLLRNPLVDHLVHFVHQGHEVIVEIIECKTEVREDKTRSRIESSLNEDLAIPLYLSNACVVLYLNLDYLRHSCCCLQKSTKNALETARTFATLFNDMELRSRLQAAHSMETFKNYLLDHAKELASDHQHPEDMRRKSSVLVSAPTDQVSHVLFICIRELETVDDDNDNLRVNWSKMSAANLEEYTGNTDLHLNGIEAPADALCCKDIDCKNESHRIALDVYYGKLVRAMTKAGQRRARTDKKFNSQPGWNEHVSGIVLVYGIVVGSQGRERSLSRCD